MPPLPDQIQQRPGHPQHRSYAAYLPTATFPSKFGTRTSSFASQVIGWFWATGIISTQAKV